MRHYLRLAVILLLVCIASSTYAASRDELAAAVAARYRVTTFGFLGGFEKIGSVLTPRQQGLGVNRPSKTFSPNLIRHQQLVTVGGGRLPLGNVHEPTLKPGEKLYLYSISTGSDYLQLDLHTVASYAVPGSKGSIPLQATIRFQYDGGLAKLTSQQVLADIAAWLDTEKDSRSFTVAPCPDAGGDNRPTSTIRLGQTPQEVRELLGPPQQQLLLGAKTIFIYRNVKLIFLDGKLSDAE